MSNISESIVRSRLRRKGLLLQKNKARNTWRPDFGLYRIIDAQDRFVVAGGEPWNYNLFLNEAADIAQ